MKKIILLAGILFIAIFTIQAQNINFSASGPSAVANESKFRVAYTINANSGDFRIGEINDFNVLMGPSVSTSQSFQSVNGTMQSSSSTTYTYMLQARKEGTFTIPAATVMVDGKKFVSNSLTVKVLPADATANQQSGNSATQSSQTIDGVEVFIKAIPAKTTVYEQEAVLMTYKMYVKGVNVSGFTEMKFPEPKGFLSQEIEASGDKQWTLENYNGKNYNTVLLKQVLLFPQHSGDLDIESGKFEVILRIPNNTYRSIFDVFGNFQEVKRVITTSPLTIKVKPLPSGKPASFANAVGNFTLTSSINTESLKVNDPITIKINISGNGNLRLAKNPEIVFPPDFEIYDAKVDVKLKNTTTGAIGTKTIEYLAIPRYAGDFTIPAAEFSYFDLKTNSYKTLRTGTYHVKVEKGESTNGQTMTTYVNQDALKVLGTDIRHINTKNLKLKPISNFFFGTVFFALCYILPALAAVVLFIIFRKQAKENANIALVRTKKANKMATKKLKIAHQYLLAHQKEKFYDETLKALWGYFSDKLNMPVANLNKENIGTELATAGIDEKLIADLNTILSTCEYARYAPGDNSAEMELIYNETVKKIEELEEKIKK